ncbi:MAG: hypothetical protein ACJAZS_000546 [Alteromonas naphthalenivorans]|jgi:hypothetical protein
MIKQKRFLGLVLLVSSFIPCYSENSFNQIANLRLRCFTQKEPVQLTEEDIKQKAKTLDLAIPTLDEHTLHSLILSLYGTTKSTPNSILNKNLWQDLELLAGETNPESSLLSRIDESATKFGTNDLAHRLTHPSDSLEKLYARQEAIKELLHNTELYNILDKALKQAGQAENDFLFMYQEESGFNKKAIASFYFNSTLPVIRYLKKLNSRTECMQAFALFDKIPSIALFTWYPITQWGINNFRSGYNKIASNTEDSKGELGKHFPTAKNYIRENVYDGPDFSWEKFADHTIEEHNKNNNEQLSEEQKDQIKKFYTEILPESMPGISTFVEDLLGKNDSDQEITEEGLVKELLSFAYKNHGTEATKSALKGLIKGQIPTSIGGLYKVGIGGGSMYVAVNREKYSNNITNYLHTQLIATSSIIRSMEQCSIAIKNNTALYDSLEHHQNLHVLFDKTATNVSYKLQKLINLLRTNTFTGQASYFSLKGRVLAAYSLMQDVKEELAPALRALGEVDALVSTTKLYQKSQDQNVRYSFPTYLDKEQPEITLSNMWNPFVPVEKTVTNSIALGGSQSQNVILTGPNAGGKSTFLKGISLSVLMAQTLGIAPVEELAFTPFAKINTYMNITDDTAGGNSLFKSEVLRAQALLQTIKNLDSKEFSLSIMDEMFSGTSPKEGAAAGYSVADNISQNTNSILLLATHFPLLTNLEKDTGNFKNYQVRIVRHKNGGFSYPFKLEKGIADQNVAMDILKEQGFDSSIVDNANAILNR